MADVFKKKCKCCNKKNYFQKIVRNESKYYLKEEDDIVDYSSAPPHIGGIKNNNIKKKDKVEYANVYVVNVVLKPIIFKNFQKIVFH